jgi:voltage-gated potassium channel
MAMKARKETRTKSAASKGSSSAHLLSDEARGKTDTFRESLRELYFGKNRIADRFRYGLLAFDAVTIAFIVGTSFLPRTNWVEWLDVIFGLVILADFSCRLYISPHPLKEFVHPATWADVAAIVSFLAPLVGEGLGFLRILRTLRLLHTYQFIARLRVDSSFFRRNEETIIAVVNLVVFLFIMTGVVYQTQHWRNPGITNYIDALYFTVTALTTTGFGDITLQGPLGRLISIVIMIFGVTLFLRLLQTLIRPHKVRYACPTCGLQRHEIDAVHCKACGLLLNIPDEGSS